MNGNREQDVFGQLIQRQRSIIKKLEEIKVKIADLKQARNELKELIKDNSERITQGLMIIDISSDSDA